MDELAGVLLHMNFVNSYLFGIAVLILDLYKTVAADRQIKLRYLIRFRQIGVKIVFSVEFVILSNRAVCCYAGPHGKLHNSFVEKRKCSGHTGANFANVSVRLTAELGGTAAEDFGLGGKLRVDFKSHNYFPFHKALPP